jgi:Domain of Unknown Function (DUF1259)
MDAAAAVYGDIAFTDLSSAGTSGASGSGSTGASGTTSTSGNTTAGTTRASGFMMTAEIPLLETEVPGFVLAAKQNSLAVAAIHNHVIGESPRVIFVHVEAVNSDPAALATNILAALQMTVPGITSDFVPTTPNGTSSGGFSSQTVAADIAPNATGSTLDNVIDVEVPRSESFAEVVPSLPNTVAAVPAEAGAHSDFHFDPVSSGSTDEMLAVAEFAGSPTQANPVIRSLAQSGWDVSALHNHFLDIQPPLLFVHAVKLGNFNTEQSDIANALNIANSASTTASTSSTR